MSVWLSAWLSMWLSEQVTVLQNEHQRADLSRVDAGSSNAASVCRQKTQGLCAELTKLIDCTIAPFEQITLGAATDEMVAKACKTALFVQVRLMTVCVKVRRFLERVFRSLMHWMDQMTAVAARPCSGA